MTMDILLSDQSLEQVKPRISRRRRFIERLVRMSSSPQLSKRRSQIFKSPKRSASCGDLDTVDPPMAVRDLHPTSDWDGSGGRAIPVTQTSQQCRETGVDCFSRLPDEIKLRIFSHLQPKELVQCSSVSRSWHEMCHDGQLWKTFDATSFYTDISLDSLTNIIINAGPFVQHLNLRGCVQIHGDWRVDKITNACKNLVTMNLEGCKFERVALHTLIYSNSRLLVLNLSGLSSVTNATCSAIAESCPNLELLDVSWCLNIDNGGIKKIAKMCKSLKDLKACEISGWDEGAMNLLFKVNTLERLDLSGCETVTDDAIRVLTEGYNSEIDPLTNRTTAPPRKLKQLNLSRCLRLTDAALRHLAQNTPDLEALQLSGIETLTDEGFEALLPTVPKLAHLDLEECSAITNATCVTLSAAPCAKSLKFLQLSYCENIGDEGLVAIIQKCDSLRNIEVDNTRCGDLTLSEACQMIHRRPEIGGNTTVGLRMVVYDCPGVTWGGVREVLSRNTAADTSKSGRGRQIIQLKCFYGWQMTVNEHTIRVLRGDLCSAAKLESKWAEYMMNSEENGTGGRRRRRRAREPGPLLQDDGEGGASWRPGRRRRGAGACSIM